MDRAYRLQYCKQCNLRNFNREKGVVCSLTGEHATFDATCESFDRDEDEAKKIQLQKQQATQTQASSGSKTNMGIIGGSLAIVGAIVWFFGGLAINRIFFYPFFLVVYGIISIVKGVNQMKAEKSKIVYNDILDDTEFN